MLSNDSEISQKRNIFQTFNFRFITAAAEVGACPLHSHEKYKALYEKLAESSHDESDMEPSDADSDDGHAGGQQV
jgi:hypothetical protein